MGCEQNRKSRAHLSCFGDHQLNYLVPPRGGDLTSSSADKCLTSLMDYRDSEHMFAILNTSIPSCFLVLFCEWYIFKEYNMPFYALHILSNSCHFSLRSLFELYLVHHPIRHVFTPKEQFKT
jgi:hypothetical protein